MLRVTFSWQKAPLSRCLAWVLSLQSATALEEPAAVVRLERDSAQWQAWVTAPQLWTRAALPPPVGNWRIQALCAQDSFELQPIHASAVVAPALEILLCIDRSEMAALSPLALRTLIAAAVAELRPEDRFVVVQYRYSADFIHVFSGSEAALSLDTLSCLPPSGPAAPLHILYSALEYCRQNPSHRRRSLLLLTEGPDWASFLVTAEDIIANARQLTIPVTVLHCGMLGERTLWRSVAVQTGGTYVWLPTADLTLLRRQLVWILRGLQTHYVLSFRPPHQCSPRQLRFWIDPPGSTAVYELGEPLTGSLGQPRRILCYFDREDTTIAPLYEELLSDLAQWLRQHPHEVIELIGHAGQEESPRTAIALGLRRAHALRRRLLQLGAIPTQIRLRSEGAQQPLFYFERTPAHQRANQRVELRWLRPAELPYEVVLDIVPSEARALQLLERWHQRGYSAYYEPILFRGEPAYRVKLWGFATPEQLSHAIRTIRYRYGERIRPY